MIFLFGGSLYFFCIGLYRLKGPVSVTYLAYGSRLKGVNYFALPFALTLFLWGLALSQLIVDDFKMNLIMIGVLVPFVLAFPAHKYLKPKWLKWLEQNHGDIMPWIEAEINEMGTDVWDNQINTQEELETWVTEYREKNNL